MLKVIKKVIASVFVVSLVVFGISACKPRETTTTETTTQPATGTSTTSQTTTAPSNSQ